MHAEGRLSVFGLQTAPAPALCPGGGFHRDPDGRSATLSGKVRDNLALGFTVPNTTLATHPRPYCRRTRPPSLRYLVEPRHRDGTAGKALVVRGFASATCWMRASWLSGKERFPGDPSLRSSSDRQRQSPHPPGGARPAAEQLVERRNQTLAEPRDCGAHGFQGRGGKPYLRLPGAAGCPCGSTCADSAAGDHARVTACGPDDGDGVATVETMSGSRPPLFLSRTMLCSAMRRAVSYKAPSTSTTLFLG